MLDVLPNVAKSFWSDVLQISLHCACRDNINDTTCIAIVRILAVGLIHPTTTHLNVNIQRTLAVVFYFKAIYDNCYMVCENAMYGVLVYIR
jgi:hypothetical protein